MTACAAGARPGEVVKDDLVIGIPGDGGGHIGFTRHDDRFLLEEANQLVQLLIGDGVLATDTRLEQHAPDFLDDGWREDQLRITG